MPHSRRRCLGGIAFPPMSACESPSEFALGHSVAVIKSQPKPANQFSRGLEHNSPLRKPVTVVFFDPLLKPLPGLFKGYDAAYESTYLRIAVHGSERIKVVEGKLPEQKTLGLANHTRHYIKVPGTLRNEDSESPDDDDAPVAWATVSFSIQAASVRVRNL